MSEFHYEKVKDPTYFSENLGCCPFRSPLFHFSGGDGAGKRGAPLQSERPLEIPLCEKLSGVRFLVLRSEDVLL